MVANTHWLLVQSGNTKKSVNLFPNHKKGKSICMKCICLTYYIYCFTLNKSTSFFITKLKTGFWRAIVKASPRSFTDSAPPLPFSSSPSLKQAEKISELQNSPIDTSTSTFGCIFYSTLKTRPKHIDVYFSRPLAITWYI